MGKLREKHGPLALHTFFLIENRLSFPRITPEGMTQSPLQSSCSTVPYHLNYIQVGLKSNELRYTAKSTVTCSTSWDYFLHDPCIDVNVTLLFYRLKKHTDSTSAHALNTNPTLHESS